MDIKEVIKIVKEKLAEAGIIEIFETEWLIAEALGVKRGNIYVLGKISENEYNKILDFTEKRSKHIPLDYITGKSNFYGLELSVNNNVLIPRPETELLVEEVLKLSKQNDKILDIGTGSGAIAIAVKKYLNAEVTAVDISSKALMVAKQNAKNNIVDIEFLQSDLFSALKGNNYDIIISNPPYIPTQDIKTLDSDVRDYEPHLALDGGESGLEIYQKIIRDLDEYLNIGGYVFFEIGIGQANEIKNMFGKNYTVEVKKDYNKIDRIIKARRQS